MVAKIALFMMLCTYMVASGLSWSEYLEDAQGKKTFVVVEESYCPWCKRFKEDILTEQEVIDALQSYEVIKIYKKPWNKKGISHVRFVPTLIVLDTEHNFVAKHEGFADKDKFIEFLDSIE